MISFKQFKLELFNIRQAFTNFHVGWKYLYSKYIFARRLKYLPCPIERPITHTNLSMHVLFGHQHLYMALWSLASYYAVSGCIGELYIHSDRTLTSKDYTVLKRFFPGAVFVDPETILEMYARRFDQYPGIKMFCKKHRNNFFLSKLMDPFMISDKQHLLFFDIDVIWFKNSNLIQREVEAGCQNSWMMEGVYEDAKSEFNTIYFKDGTALDSKYSKYNSGIILFDRDNFNMRKISHYFERIDMTRPESQHWVEQSGYAYNLEKLKLLPRSEYIIKGQVKDNTIVKHYTGPRRVEFYAKGLPIIKNIIKNP